VTSRTAWAFRTSDEASSAASCSPRKQLDRRAFGSASSRRGWVRMKGRTARTFRLLIAVAFAVSASSARAAEALPSWNDGEARRSILAFVESVTREGAPTFVPPAERIAVFDNDGTLWAEQPLYFQLVYALDQVKALAPKHPEWKTQPPFSELLAGNT